MVQNNTNVDGMKRYKRTKKLQKIKRLVDGRPKWEDEKRMDMNRIEEEVDKAMDVDADEDNYYKLKAIAIALKFVEVQSKAAHEQANAEEDDIIKIILSRAHVMEDEGEDE